MQNKTRKFKSLPIAIHLKSVSANFKLQFRELKTDIKLIFWELKTNMELLYQELTWQKKKGQTSEIAQVVQSYI